MRAFEIQIAEGSLRNTYNTIWKRRNPAGARFFEVYSKKPKAKEHFKLLAVKLLKKKIDPRIYMTVMCSYGKYSDSRYLPPTGWLVKDSVIEEIYKKWLHKRELAKYGGDSSQMRRGLSGDSEITEDEILRSLKGDKESLEGLALHEEGYIDGEQHWNRVVPIVLLAQYRGGAISSWYVVLRKDFLESEAAEYLTKHDRKKISQCRGFYKSNPRVWKKAKLFLRGER